MHKNATKCNETLRKWCKNKHKASKIIDTFETYQRASTFGSLVLSPTGSRNLGFTTEGRLAAVLIITFSWGFQLGGYIYKTPTSTPHHQQVFWRRCQRERRFLQGESLASNLLLCYCFALFYFCLHRFIKNTKKISSFIVVFTCLLLALLEWVL
jgi:hypothetical protein